MARREQLDAEVDEALRNPATDDIAPSASGRTPYEESGNLVNDLLSEIEGQVKDDRARQTLTGALLVSRAIMFAGIVIANAIRARQV